MAESLFREGKRLSSEKKFSEACPKFEESYRLDPGLGTLLNLATCHLSFGHYEQALLVRAVLCCAVLCCAV